MRFLKRICLWGKSFPDNFMSEGREENKIGEKCVQSTMDCDSLLSLWAMQPCCEPDGMSTGYRPIKS